MFVQTHRSVKEDGTFTVYRDREANLTVTHYTAHRGGCFHIGEVTMRGTNGTSFAFTVKQAPWPVETGPRTAASYWARHVDKLR